MENWFFDHFFLIFSSVPDAVGEFFAFYFFPFAVWVGQFFWLVWNSGGLGVSPPPFPRVKVCFGGWWRNFPFLLFPCFGLVGFSGFFFGGGRGLIKFDKWKPKYRYDIWPEVRLFAQGEWKELESLRPSTVVLTPSRLNIRNWNEVEDMNQRRFSRWKDRNRK